MLSQFPQGCLRIKSFLACQTEQTYRPQRASTRRRRARRPEILAMGAIFIDSARVSCSTLAQAEQVLAGHFFGVLIGLFFRVASCKRTPYNYRNPLHAYGHWLWGQSPRRGGPGCLNNFSASISGASARVRLPSGAAAS
jgi:hypothetical protein